MIWHWVFLCSVSKVTLVPFLQRFARYRHALSKYPVKNRGVILPVTNQVSRSFYKIFFLRIFPRTTFTFSRQATRWIMYSIFDNLSWKKTHKKSVASQRKSEKEMCVFTLLFFHTKKYCNGKSFVSSANYACSATRNYFCCCLMFRQKNLLDLCDFSFSCTRKYFQFESENRVQAERLHTREMEFLKPEICSKNSAITLMFALHLRRSLLENQLQSVTWSFSLKPLACNLHL